MRLKIQIVTQLLFKNVGNFYYTAISTPKDLITKLLITLNRCSARYHLQWVSCVYVSGRVNSWVSVIKHSPYLYFPIYRYLILGLTIQRGLVDQTKFLPIFGTTYQKLRHRYPIVVSIYPTHVKHLLHLI